MSETQFQQQSVGQMLRVVAPRLAALAGHRPDGRRGKAKGQFLPRLESGDPLPRVSALSGVSEPERRADGGRLEGPDSDANDGPSQAEFQSLRDRVEELESELETEDAGTVF